MLEIEDMETGYGKKQVLFGLSMEVQKGEIIALIGPNGAGKSTLLKVICGLIPAWTGEIRFNGSILNGESPAKNISHGITFAPQGNRVFHDMTVMENLEIGGFHLPKNKVKERIAMTLELFPVLRERLRHDAGKLSGGEQQMLALARALVPEPKLLMLDEPSLGLSPNLVNKVFENIFEINKEFGVSILIVEQKVREIVEISNRVYGMKLGKIVFKGHSNELKENKNTLKNIFI